MWEGLKETILSLKKSICFPWLYLLFVRFQNIPNHKGSLCLSHSDTDLLINASFLTVWYLRQSRIKLPFRDNKVLPIQGRVMPSIRPIGKHLSSRHLLRFPHSLEWQSLNENPKFFLFQKKILHFLPPLDTQNSSIAKSRLDGKKLGLGRLLCLPSWTKGCLSERWRQHYHCGNIIRLSFPLPMCCCYP